MAKVVAKTKKRHRFKNPKDPLVPFDRLRLTAAMRALRVSQADIVARATEGRIAAQSISDLLNNPKKRTCHLSLLTAVSKAFPGVPLEWLQGESASLPLQHFIRRHPFRSVAESQFMQRCLEAYDKDTGLWEGHRQERTKNREQQKDELFYALYAILDAARWSRTFFEPDQDVLPLTAERVPMAVELENETTEAVIRALELILTPWFDRHVHLDCQAVIDLARRLR